MNKKQNNFFTSEFYQNSKIVYGFFTRKGGFSSTKYKSLNCSLNTNDNKNNVKKNINVAKKKLGIEKTNTKFIKQTHSTKITIINNKNIFKEITADGSITKEKNISLAILTADCAPVFFIDTKNDIICAIHCGWKGCLNNIFINVLKKFDIIAKNNPKIIAIVGPCLKKDYYEVDHNFKKNFIEKNFLYEDFFSKNLNSEKFEFDMRGLIDFQIRELYIDRIFHIQRDTFAEKDLFYSHRRATKNKEVSTGRMINIIGYKQ